MGTPSPTPCKPFEKGLTLNCIASRISCVWNCLVGNIYAHRRTNARLKTGQGLKALAGEAGTESPRSLLLCNYFFYRNA